MIRQLCALAAALVLAACASAPGGADLPPGATRDQVLARMGPPTRAVPLPGGGQRLQYSQQPIGPYVWMADLDPAGRLMGVRQVMNEADFNRIVPGQWTRADVEREFGPPARVESVSSWTGPILTYRWRDIQGASMFYSIYLDPQGVVRRAHPGMEARDRFFDFRF